MSGSSEVCGAIRARTLAVTGTGMIFPPHSRKPQSLSFNTAGVRTSGHFPFSLASKGMMAFSLLQFLFRFPRKKKPQWIVLRHAMVRCLEEDYFLGRLPLQSLCNSFTIQHCRAFLIFRTCAPLLPTKSQSGLGLFSPAPCISGNDRLVGNDLANPNETEG